MSIIVNTLKFEAALKRVLLHTSRDLPTVLNQTAADVIIRAAQATKKADPAVIEQALVKATVSITTGASGKLLKKPKKKLIPTEIVYKIIAKRTGVPGLSNVQMSAATRKFIASRKSAAGFNAWAGWNNALVAFGGRGFGSKAQQPGFSKSTAARGSGRPASVGQLMARFSNTAAWIENIGVGPLQEALNAKAVDMHRHVEQKLAERCREASR